MNWIIPNKILALSSPTGRKGEGLPPENFVEPFQRMRVRSIVRLNEQLYDESVFRKSGITVHDLEYVDGSCPDDVRQKHACILINIENNPAVHSHS
jgi:hypothetical protein